MGRLAGRTGNHRFSPAASVVFIKIGRQKVQTEGNIVVELSLVQCETSFSFRVTDLNVKAGIKAA